MQIIDEKSLIKTYQNEIRSLKEELDELEREIVTVPQLKHTGAKDALLSQIQSLTKLILVSTKSSHQSDPGIRYSFGEEEVSLFNLAVENYGFVLAKNFLTFFLSKMKFLSLKLMLCCVYQLIEES